MAILSDREDEKKSFNHRRKNKDVSQEAEDAEEQLQHAFECAYQDAMMTSSPSFDGDAVSSSKDYRGRYYFDKFKVLPSSSTFSEEFMPSLRRSYLEGLQWCLAYYVKGCISWKWYGTY